MYPKVAKRVDLRCYHHKKMVITWGNGDIN